jgi:hypothetical protein
MADAHTRIFHELLEPLLQIDLNGTQLRVIFWTARNTYGRQGEHYAPYSWLQVAREIICERTRVNRAGAELLKQGILCLDESGRIGINKKRIIELGECAKSHSVQSRTVCKNSTQSVRKSHTPTPYEKEKRKSAVPAPTVQPQGEAPNVKAIIDHFSQRCQELRGFKPAINGGKDGAAVKRALAEGETLEALRGLVDWFLRSKKADELGVALSTALSAHSRNLFRQERARRPGDDVAARTRAYLQQTEAAA